MYFFLLIFPVSRMPECTIEIVIGHVWSRLITNEGEKIWLTQNIFFLLFHIRCRKEFEADGSTHSI